MKGLVVIRSSVESPPGLVEKVLWKLHVMAEFGMREDPSKFSTYSYMSAL